MLIFFFFFFGAAAERCERIDVREASKWRSLPLSPLILENFVANRDFAATTQREPLLAMFGDRVVTLTSSNSYSQHEQQSTLGEYARGQQSSRANESVYLFGPQPNLQDLIATYRAPQCRWCGDGITKSFGFGPRLSGVSFHTHGPGFAETLHGRKRWYFFPPADRPPIDDPDLATRDYAFKKKPAYDCILHPEELIFFPKDWWHATLNLDDHTVFVSTFLPDDENDECGFFPS